MEIQSLFGLPAHPLLVHVPVVLVPLAAIGAVLLVIRRSWIERFGWAVVVIAGIGWLGTLLAASSGEGLTEKVNRSATLHHHIELGGNARLFAFALFAALLLLVAFDWWRRRAGDEVVAAKLKKPVAIAGVLAALTVVSAGTATWWIVQTGHSGAKSTWENVNTRSANGG